MPIRKNRTISLRLSEEEFEALKAIHDAQGAKSISAFVRATMNRAISEATKDNCSLELKVQEIDGKLSILDGEVARLSRMFGRDRRPRSGDRHEEA